MTQNHILRHLCRRILCGALLCLSLAIPAYTQDAGFGSINGTITDQKGSVVAGAKVTVIQIETGISREAVTTSAGTYAAAFLKPGRYEVLIAAPGFAKVDRKGISVLVGQKWTRISCCRSPQRRTR